MTLWPISMLSRIFDSDRARHPGEPGGREEPSEHQPAAGDLEPALGPDHLADVARIALAEVGDDPLADRVELLAEGLDLLGGQVREAVVVIADLLFGQRSSSTSPTGTETQIWMSSSSALETSPVTRLRTLPAVLRQVQVWQMPMRQPNWGLSPGLFGLLEQ